MGNTMKSKSTMGAPHPLHPYQFRPWVHAWGVFVVVFKNCLLDVTVTIVLLTLKKMIKLEKFIILLCHALFPFLRSTLSIPWESRRQPHSLINLRVLVFPFEPVLDYFHIILKYV